MLKIYDEHKKNVILDSVNINILRCGTKIFTTPIN